MKFFTVCFFLIAAFAGIAPEVKVSGAMKNIMMKGDLSAYASIDTINRTHLYGLGPVAGLKGEIIVLDGKVFSTEKVGDKLQRQQDKVLNAALFVYSHVSKWKLVTLNATVNNYAALEALVASAAKTNGYNTEIPFAFRIEAMPESINFHVIDWEEGAVHTLENHKQFAYNSNFSRSEIALLGFYSTHHQSIFTHHTTFMHVHLLDEKTKTVGHLDDLRLNGLIRIWLPMKE